MRKKYYTLVIFPGTTGTPKEFRISKWLVFGSLLTCLTLFLVLTGASYYFSHQFYQLQGQKVELTALKRGEKIKKVQLEKISQQLKNFEMELARLERFEKKLRVITASENSPHAVEKNWGVGGPYGLSSHSFTTSLEKSTRSMLERLNSGMAQLDHQAKIQFLSFQELDDFFKNQTSLLLATPSIWPTRGWVTSGFGFRKSPFTGLREKHEGWDIAAREGSPVRAAADGIVVVAGKDYGYGNMVEIEHGYGLVTRYGHNSKFLIRAGDRVKRGQIIARVGNTGRSTGPHLHYEVILNGIPVSPKNYILED